MGYTHYWNQDRAFSDAEWQTVVQALLCIARQAMTLPIALSADNGETSLSNHAIASGDLSPNWGAQPVFQINGLGPLSHETFVLYREGPAHSDTADRGFNFCKTQRKPYDQVVTAMLCYLDSVFPDHIEASSDGDLADWQDGLRLARAALPDVSNIFAPRNLRFDAIWTDLLIKGDRYAALLGRPSHPGAPEPVYICHGYRAEAVFNDEAARTLTRQLRLAAQQKRDLPYPEQAGFADARLQEIAASCATHGGAVPSMQPLDQGFLQPGR